MKISLTDAAMFAIAVVGIYSWFITKSIKNTLIKEEENDRRQRPPIEFGGRVDGRA